MLVYSEITIEQIQLNTNTRTQTQPNVTYIENDSVFQDGLVEGLDVVVEATVYISKIIIPAFKVRTR